MICFAAMITFSTVYFVQITVIIISGCPGIHESQPIVSNSTISLIKTNQDTLLAKESIAPIVRDKIAQWYPVTRLFFASQQSLSQCNGSNEGRLPLATASLIDSLMHTGRSLVIPAKTLWKYPTHNTVQVDTIRYANNLKKKSAVVFLSGVFAVQEVVHPAWHWFGTASGYMNDPLTMTMITLRHFCELKWLPN